MGLRFQRRVKILPGVRLNKDGNGVKDLTQLGALKGKVEQLQAQVDHVLTASRNQATHLGEIRRLIADLQRRVRVLENGPEGAGGSPDPRRCAPGVPLRASGPKQEARALFRGKLAAVAPE